MTTTFPCLYEITCYEVHHCKRTKYFVVVNTLDMTESLFDTLAEALEYADNGELSPEAQRILKTYQV